MTPTLEKRSVRFASRGAVGLRGTLSLLLVLLIAAAFWPTLENGFLDYDDDVYVTMNPHVLGGVSAQNIGWAFTATRASNWHPITWLSHQLDCTLFGPDARAHHAVSLALHAVTAGLLLHLLWLMTGSLWRSMFVALVFAVHPVHVESVAWVAERKDVLAALAWFAVLWAYLRFVRQPGPRGLHLVCAFYTLGLMAKPMLVTLPFVLLLLDCWPLNRFGPGMTAKRKRAPATWRLFLPPSRLVLEKAPLFVLAALSAAVTILAQQLGGAMETLERIGLGTRVAQAVVSYGDYLRQVLWPSGLAALYPHPESVSGPAFALSFTTLALITAAALRPAMRNPAAIVGWLWFLGTLVPVAGLVQVGTQARADRYLHLPIIGLAIAVVWGAVPLVHRPVWRRALVVLAVVAATMWIIASNRQTRYWHDSLTLFARALSVTRDNYMAHNGAGVALMNAGRLEEARDQFEQALRLQPYHYQALGNLGSILLQLGDPQGALQRFSLVLKLNPGDYRAYANIGNVYSSLGRMDEAVAYYEEALRRAPGHPIVKQNLDNARAQRARSTGR